MATEMPRRIAVTETSPLQEVPGKGINYRHCDFCNETVITDVWAGKEEAEWRMFYNLVEHGLVCCEPCLPVVLNMDWEMPIGLPRRSSSTD